MSTIKLVPDKSLLCADFNGYKLSSGSDQVTTYTKSLTEGLCSGSTREAGSYLHTRQDALHNCLVADTSEAGPNEYATVYCYNKRGHILAYDYSLDALLCPERVVWQLEQPDGADAARPALLLPGAGLQDGRTDQDDSAMFGVLRPSLVFPNRSVAVAADGVKGISVLQTGDRRPQAHHTWLTVFSATIGACEVVDARIVPRSSNQTTSPDSRQTDTEHLLHVLLVAVAPPTLLPVAPPPHLSSSPSVHLITWLTLSSKNDGEYHVERERLYTGSATLEYCSFSADCTGVVLLTHQHYTVLHDSSNPQHGDGEQQQSRQDTVAGQGADGQGKPKPLYIFKQTDDDVTVRLSVGASSAKVRPVVSSTHLTVHAPDGGDLFRGTLQHAVDPETATWNTDGDTLEISVCKSVTGQRWVRLLQETDLLGEEVEDGELGAESSDRMAHLTSETWGTGCSAGLVDDKPAYNPGQLESCDDAESDLLLLVLQGDRGPSAPSTAIAQLGNTQYLATIQAGPGSPPLFCLRHDVDGVVWRVEQSTHQQFCHVATFNAFGYVKASKSMAKFTAAPTDCSYIAVCDVRSHVYLFCQPLPLGGELKNRRTGKVVSKVARQFLLSVPSHQEIMGIVTLTNVVFVCTDSNVYAFALRLEEA